jgi:hypothetical protein
MKSLEELVAEFKREVLGEEEPPQERPEQTEQRTGSEGVPVPQREPPVSEQDFDLVLDVDLQAPAHAAPVAVERQGLPGPSANLLVEPPPSDIAPEPIAGRSSVGGCRPVAGSGGAGPYGRLTSAVWTAG